MNEDKPKFFDFLSPRALFSLLLGFATVAFYAFSTPPEYKACRGQRPMRPEFNGYPIGFLDCTCRDLALIDARIMTGSRADGSFSRNQAEHQVGLSAQPDDVIRVLLWFHNSGTEMKRPDTTARAVRVGTIIDMEASTTHKIRGVLSAENAETVTSADYGGDIQIHTELPSLLQYVPDTALICLQASDLLERGLSITEPCGNFPDGKQRYAAKITDSLINKTPKIGDLKAGDEYSGYVRFHLKVIRPEISK